MEKVTLRMYPYMPSLISESTVKIREKEKVKTNRARNDALLQICILTKQWPQALLVAFSQPLPGGPSGQLYNFQCSVHLKNACHVPGTVLCVGDSAMKRTDTILTLTCDYILVGRNR